MDDPSIDAASPVPPVAADHAIVIGASMAGLLAARVLADHYARVTVIERDALPDNSNVRSGVPQARHLHGLLMRGQQLLERRFPGLQRELIARGAPQLSWTEDWAYYSDGRWAPRYPTPYVGATCSRGFLEGTIRARLRERGNVQFVARQAVVGLASTPDRQRVCGVRLQERADVTVAEPTALSAALVVDASGRGSHAPEWLVDLGYASPDETAINAALGYASRWYRRPRKRSGSWQSLLINSRVPDQPRSGGVYPVEGERWIVTLGGIGGVYPPTDTEAFLEFVRALDHPALYEAIKDAEPLTPVYGYRRTDNRFRHYDRLSRMPGGFVVLGDAVCAFNPVYGQGMTAAALAAERLDAWLHRSSGSPPDAALVLEFQRQLAKTNATPWLLATGADLKWPTTTGANLTRRDRLVQRYIDRVLLLTGEDAVAHRVFTEVAHLLRPPTALFSPRMVAGVLRREVRSRALAALRSGRSATRDRTLP